MATAPQPNPQNAAWRFEFLAKAGEVLAASLEYEETLRRVAELSLPDLGDLCVVDVIEEGELRRLASAHVRPEKAQLIEDLRRHYPPGGDSPAPAARVLRTGHPELLVEVTPDIVAERTRNPEHESLIRRLGMRSHIAVPMVARGTTVGVISLGITESDRRYGEDDVALATDLARRAAVAVDNARLYRSAQREIAERARAEAALRRSESRFRAMMEQSLLSTQILDPSGRTVGVNKAFEELWGLTVEVLADYNIRQDPQLVERGIAPYLERAFNGEAVELPAIAYDASKSVPIGSTLDDAVRWVRAFAYPIKDPAGTVEEVVLIHEDVTAEVRGAEQLRASEERLRVALHGAHMNVWDWELTENRVRCSENAREFWGIDVGHVDDFLAVVHPDDVALLRAVAISTIEGGAPYESEYRIVRENGGVRWVTSRGRLRRAEDGTPASIIGVTVDITDRKLAEEATRLLADAGETLGASLDAGLTLKNLARVVVPSLADWCAVDLVAESGALERAAVFHADPARVALGTELFAKYPPRRSDAYGAYRVLETGKPEWANEIAEDVLAAVAHDAEHLAMIRELHLRSYVCVPLVSRGRAIGVLTLVYAESGRTYGERDVSLAQELARRAAAAVDNARLYERLREEDRRKDEFLATLAHELRNPLAPLRTGLGVLRSAPASDVVETTYSVMERQLAHMVRLVDDLLDVSRVTRGRIELHLEDLELGSVVANAVEVSGPALDGAGVKFAAALPEQPIVFRGDRTRIAQVLSNLLNNAAKYTPRGGRVDLVVHREGNDLLVRVQDTGVGIPREMLGEVFEMFTQVQRSTARGEGGLGIGLTLVRRLVELHGGRVWAESEGLDRGTTLFVHLPGCIVAREAPAPAVRAPASARTARRVLVVDDNEDAAEMLSMLLDIEGHDVRTAASGPAALEVIRTFAPEIAFLDIGMPGMDGFELARRLRADARLADILLVAVTGWGQDDDRRQSREAGFDAHLTKPVEPDAVREAIASVAERAR